MPIVDAKDNPTPLAPEDLARGYADVAFGYHKRLPALEASIEEVRSIAIASHGMHARLAQRIEDVASAVKAGPPTTVPTVTTEPPFELRYHATATGSHVTIEVNELERMKTKFAEREAEERGAKEALAELHATEERRAKQAKETREKVTLVLALVLAVCSAAAWALGHVTASLAH
jgi:phage shock protein A